MKKTDFPTDAERNMKNLARLFNDIQEYPEHYFKPEALKRMLEEQSQRDDDTPH